jgi:hypothetical protein
MKDLKRNRWSNLKMGKSGIDEEIFVETVSKEREGEDFGLSRPFIVTPALFKTIAS